MQPADSTHHDSLNSANSASSAYSAYSADDRVARDRFLAAAKKFRTDHAPQAQLESFLVPSKRAADLFVDFLYLKPTGACEKILILTSGVHGIETPTGSALQLLFLKEVLPQLKREDLGIIVVHGLNPFGYRFGRRNTEANVNLNRSFGASPELYKTANNGYEKLKKHLHPVAPVRARFSTTRTTLMLARLLTFGRFSAATLNQTIAQGQYVHPEGLEFGGFAPEPQVGFLVGKLREILPSYEKIVLLDLHTGLGDKYELHLIPGDHPGCVDPDLFRALIGRETENNFYKFTRGDTKGFYKTTGDLNSVFPQLALGTKQCLALTMEFGTLGNGLNAKIKTLDRVLQENRGYHAGYRSDRDRAKVTALFSDLFDPKDAKWRANALNRGRRFILKVAAELDRM